LATGYRGGEYLFADLDRRGAAWDLRRSRNSRLCL